MRDAKKDLEACNAATPGPWGICLGSGAHVCTGVMQDGEEDFGTMICDCLPDYFLKPAVEKPGDHRHNMRFIAMAREALPYWIERAQKSNEFVRHILTSMAQYEIDAHALPEGTPAPYFIDWTVERIGKLEAALLHIAEYWNRNRNDETMHAALWEIIETAEAALGKARGER